MVFSLFSEKNYLNGVDWIMNAAVGASFAASYLSNEKPMKVFNKISGSAFIGFGLALIFES